MRLIFPQKTKRIASSLLLIWILNLILPTAVYALTSGPSQPESQSFQPASVSDMVDLSTGDFKYNIPLMDVDGYPLNLNYQSGIGIDDEASWVGLGWNLNVGAINRQMRGVPDDFSGDELVTNHFTKSKVTVGGRVTAKVESKGKAKIGGSFSFGVFSDSYTGIGAEIGANAGISFGLSNSGLLTSSMGIGVLSSTASGVDASPYISLSIGEAKTDKSLNKSGLSSSLGYNSRAGLKSLTLGGSFGLLRSSNTMAFNTEPINPKVNFPYKSDYGSFSFDVGGSAFWIFGGVGGTGYRNVRSVAVNQINSPQYGFLYAERGKNNKNAVLDFIREKENPILNETPNLALPIQTPDVFSYSSQNGSGQFRLFRGGTGIFSDNEAEDKSNVSSVGLDLGFGAYFHFGVTLFQQNTTTTTRKWQSDNSYLNKGNFQDASYTDPAKEHVYFKKTDEKNIEDAALTSKLHGASALAVKISGKKADSAFRDNTNLYATNLPASTISKNAKQAKTTAISYLTASEAKLGGLDKEIKIYKDLTASDVNAGLALPQPLLNSATERARVNDVRKKHHISEMTVTGTGGERMIYGIPVYNTIQNEYSFAIGNKTKGDYTSINGNLVNLNLKPDGTINHDKGIDEYNHKESLPAYATSFLLTGMVSPDYQDLTNNGITNDDQGTAIKFNYSKISDFGWRTPYSTKVNGVDAKTATLNKGLLADPDDDKGSIIYGKKELYYVQSIESKTQVAYFITEDRLDGLGVSDFTGTPDLNKKQKRLKEIRLYSKGNLKIPIKVVKFEYGYDLCHQTPNSRGGVNQGKLTLKKVWFEYGGTQKGKYHPYKFSYNETASDSNGAGDITKYTSLATDRWGVYKPNVTNFGSFTNDEFPYANQNTITANKDAGLFHLNQIELPTGGIISITYEADDYAYVQDKKAMVMTQVKSFNGSDANNPLKGATGLTVPLDSLLPAHINPTDYPKVLHWFKQTYLNGSDYLYTKSYIKLSTSNANSYGNDNDFVSAYCKVNRVEINGNEATVKFEAVNEGNVTQNPILFAARQKIKNEYPRYAYPGFENKVKANDAGKAIEAAIGAILNAYSNLSELKENFYQKAERRNYATKANASKSFVKLVKNNGRKLGGGIRVKKIAIADSWQQFTNDQTAPAGVYGQSYTYTKMENGQLISSGVASYEPSVGNDENPLKQPVPYIQKIKGAINNYFELEEPFGESFFPGPSVVYSKVTVKDLEAGGAVVENPKTGSIVNEFYTARDFPVKVTVLPIQKHNPPRNNQYSLVNTNSVEEMVLSQGYSIEVNDMHGKAKATRVLNQARAEISSSVYHYGVENPNAEKLKLSNAVKTIDDKGLVANRIMGRDIEFFTDFREQEYRNSGETINIGGDVFPVIFGIPFLLPHFPYGGNNEYKLFRSACAVKVIQNYGILNKVVKTENGSSIAVENVAYDATTGEAIVTKTQNEFGKSYYTVNLPAYWVYKGMGPAYQTLGTVLKDLKTTDGVIDNSVYRDFLMPGDQIIDLGSTGVSGLASDPNPQTLPATYYWVADIAGGRRLIDQEGNVRNANLAYAKVVRSGYRNVLQANTSTVVCMNNPIEGNVFKLGADGDLAALKVINTSLNLYDDKWAAMQVETNGENTQNIIETTPFFTYQPYTLSGNETIYACEFINQDGYYVCNFLPSGYWTTKTFFDSIAIKPSIPINIENSTLTETEFEICINIPISDYYSLGTMNGTFVQIDGEQWNFYTYGYNNPLNWNICGEHRYITAGNHKLKVRVDKSIISGISGLEIYRNSVQELKNVDAYGTGLNRIFSTSSIINNYQLVSRYRNFTLAPSGDYIAGDYVNHYYRSDGSPIDVCTTNLPSNTSTSTVNPYLYGYLGNWRPYQNKVYQTQRNYDAVFTADKKGIDAKNAGYYTSYKPWWKLAGSQWTTSSPAEWVTANTITLYDKYGQELENVDALKRYSAAKFDFNGEVPAAVASNAMNREVYANSFEDTRFNVVNSTPNKETQFTSNSATVIANLISPVNAHTGNYGLKLTTDGISLATRTHAQEHKTTAYINPTAYGFKLFNVAGLYQIGFEPVPAKEYIINAWVKDGQATNRNVNAAATIVSDNSAAVTIPLSCKAIVEGWKLLEGKFTATTAAVFKVNLKSTNGDIYIDDIRIHPVNAHLKSYAYNDKNFKLMAELDENAFATFYEYDDEGSLIRVKKETERGIMTLKETRSAYRKNPNAL